MKAEELNKLNEELTNLKQKLNELSEDELKAVAGGEEPEEFEWRDRGFQTPIKENNKDGWQFEAIGDENGEYRKRSHSYTGRTDETK